MVTRAIHATAVNRPGAIAILQLAGPCTEILKALSGIDDWPLHRIRLVDLGGIDHGLVVRLNDRITQIMPHGGPRILQRITERLVELGVEIVSSAAEIDARWIYPEAEDDIEALAMFALARAQSPLAADLLLLQPRIWRQVRAGSMRVNEHDRLRSIQLNRLITPPAVVLAGKPNVGKSTLSNALLGRAMSIAMDMPGTTRDYVAARMDLRGLVVDWHDTPGIHEPGDLIESKAALLARRLTERADLLIAMRDHEHDWPELPREPDLRIINKCDRSPVGETPVGPLCISALKGHGLEEIVSHIREMLVPDLNATRPWLFDSRLLKSEDRVNQTSSGS